MNSCTTRSGPGQPTVLILDDDPDALEEIQEILELEDLYSVTATSSEEAMSFLSRHAQVAVVVTDVHIVGSDGRMTNGVDFMVAAKARYPDRALSFIVLSGDAGAITASIETGAIDFLTKPLMPEALLSAIENASTKPGEDEEKLSDKLMRKVAETTRSLQQATVDLAEHERALSESQSAYDRRRLQGAKLRQGLSHGHIKPWFQPQVCLHTGELRGFEALVRWEDPIGGLQNPVEFLPLADEIGMMLDLDAAVQRQAFDALKEARQLGLACVDIGINVTAGQLADPGLIDNLCLEADRAGLEPKDIGVEILESAMLDEVAADPAKANINRLAEIGFRIELDDFGTGHAGLSSLRDLLVSRIKIDRSFVCNIHRDEKLQSFTRALIGLAKTLGIAVLAEGVETEAELAWLEAEGCDLVQGYFFAKPMPKHAAMEWAQEHFANRAAADRPMAIRA